ncbi:predicted protein [Naegleria gruberi]|uniref:protein-serine/threonine phosphatase n=1 Tax=Naegleria gruberi TaxID=5762 RepID=D2W4L6_NAEGR|nr:uncharacterized protein NAEGRDRAFT_76350 [Naegleria gruberi]EFC35980.1 predicted protein [Naegleria gruberi]|eukprot:XP_002668724.1 predicted protein [Naegleria gruberi strain NEG-M]
MSKVNDELDCNEIVPRLFLGSEDAAYADINILKGEPYKFTHICVCGFGLIKKHEKTSQIEYHHIKAVDLPVYNITKDVKSCAEFIDNALNGDENNRVLVHCSRGVSRSASIVTAYLMLKKGMTFEEAYYGNVKKKRSIVCLNQGFAEQLKGL